MSGEGFPNTPEQPLSEETKLRFLDLFDEKLPPEKVRAEFGRGEAQHGTVLRIGETDAVTLSAFFDLYATVDQSVAPYYRRVVASIAQEDGVHRIEKRYLIDPELKSIVVTDELVDEKEIDDFIEDIRKIKRDEGDKQAGERLDRSSEARRYARSQTRHAATEREISDLIGLLNRADEDNDT